MASSFHWEADSSHCKNHDPQLSVGQKVLSELSAVTVPAPVIDRGVAFSVYSDGIFRGRGYYQLTKQLQKKPSNYHIPVLLQEVLFWIFVDPKGTYLDCTLGGGAHAEAILRRLTPTGLLLGMDLDEEAIDQAGSHLAGFRSRLRLKCDNFSDLGEFLREQGVEKVDGILMDLGISSHQIDAAYRGFSFMQEGRLDMRFGHGQVLDAIRVVNEYSEEELARIMFEYGEERQARVIARRIVQARKKARIESTKALAAIVEERVNPRYLNKSLARIFQAIRIEVNAELQHLQTALAEALDHLKPSGRLAVISYHSLEDRMVKQFFKANAGRCVCPPELPVCTCNQSGKLKILTRKPVRPEQDEIARNPRSRSAKLRVAERI